MSQHPSWADYSGTGRITLAVVLLIIAAAAVCAGTRLRRPVRLPRPGRGATYALLTAWVVVIFAFLAVLSDLTQQASQQGPHQARLTGPIAPITFTAVAVTFVVIIVLGRSYDWPVRLAGAAIGALAAPMIFEFPFDFIVMTRITQTPAWHLVAFFVPLYLIEIVTLALLAASPMVRLRRVTCFGFASILVVFAIWALSGFGYPSTEPAYALNVVSKILAFVTALTLFLPPPDLGAQPSARASAEPVPLSEGAEFVPLSGQVGSGGADDQPGDAVGGQGRDVVRGHRDVAPAGVLQRVAVAPGRAGGLAHQVDLGRALLVVDAATGEVPVAA
jgi:hypothetical protein